MFHVKQNIPQKTEMFHVKHKIGAMLLYTDVL